MKCDKCGKEIPETINYCPSCKVQGINGNPTSSNQEEILISDEVDSTDNNYSENNEKGISSSVKASAVVVFGLLIFISLSTVILPIIYGIILGVILSRKTKKSEKFLVAFVKFVLFIIVFALINVGICIGGASIIFG